MRTRFPILLARCGQNWYCACLCCALHWPSSHSTITTVPILTAVELTATASLNSAPPQVRRAKYRIKGGIAISLGRLCRRGGTGTLNECHVHNEAENERILAGGMRMEKWEENPHKGLPEADGYGDLRCIMLLLYNSYQILTSSLYGEGNMKRTLYNRYQLCNSSTQCMSLFEIFYLRARIPSCLATSKSASMTMRHLWLCLAIKRRLSYVLILEEKEKAG